jgi:hypothetical protein
MSRLRRWLVALAALAGMAVVFGACTSNDNGGVINPGPSSTPSSTTSSVP